MTRTSDSPDALRRTHLYRVPASPAERETIDAAAELECEPAAEFIRTAAYERALAVLSTGDRTGDRKGR